MQINYNIDDVITDLKDILSIESVEDVATSECPFGENCALVLNTFLDRAKKMGFKTKNYDNYIGEVIFGSGQDVAILCHLDVVPAGNGWDTPPFKAIVKKDKIYGRGAVDNKGPAVAVLHALKLLKNEGFEPKRTIKFILGTNEETGWKDIDYYKKVAKMPAVGFSPDGNFPVIIAEKGILHLKLTVPVSERFQKLISFVSGGERENVVPSSSTFTTIANISTMLNHFDQFEAIGDNKIKITEFGVNEHASTPHRGINAIWKVVSDLYEITKCPNVNFVYNAFCKNTTGENLQIACTDDSGDLTMNVGTIKYVDDTLELGIDIRYPASYSDFTIINMIKDTLPKSFLLEVTHTQKPICVKNNSPLVRLLLSAYREVTGDEISMPFAIGGGTYARALDLGVAFGPVMPNENSLAHKPNEYIAIDKLRQLIEIYYTAIKKITEND